MSLAEIPYPRIDPDIIRIGEITVRWYGVSYVIGFGLAFLVLRGLARRGRWPVDPDRVADVLFWGILGVFVGGRIGWIFFYGLWTPDFSWGEAWKVWKGGMSFHGGAIAVILAYVIFALRTKKPLGAFFDGIGAAAPIGVLCVRMGNFINAELYGRLWDGPWAMRFPLYDEFAREGGVPAWEAARDAGAARALWTAPRHPSQIYEALGEGLLLFLFLRWLMLRKGVGGGRIAAWFLIGYGAIRSAIEQVRQPDAPLEGVTGIFTRGQQLSLIMIAAGVVLLVLCARKARRAIPPV